MKLFLMWLLGVPLLVTSMVLAQSLPMGSQRTVRHDTGRPSPCLRQGYLHDVTPAIANQGHRVSCNRLSVQ